MVSVPFQLEVVALTGTHHGEPHLLLLSRNFTESRVQLVKANGRVLPPDLTPYPLWIVPPPIKDLASLVLAGISIEPKEPIRALDR